MQRDDILNEVRRIAKDNGGKPVGRERFEKLTGIKPYHWLKYWTRFTDIQREAGFEPNKLQSAYDDDYLLTKIIELIRELRKFPTSNDIRHRYFNDRTFPRHGAFERLGTKTQLIAKVRAYSASHAGYDDVVELLGDADAAVVSNVDGLTHEPLGNSATKYGFVYLVRGHPGEYKIGHTNLVDRRLSELGATASVEPVLIHEIKTDDPAGVEGYWHRRFQDKRMKGEWFSLNVADVSAFKQWRRIC